MYTTVEWVGVAEEDKTVKRNCANKRSDRFCARKILLILVVIYETIVL